MYITRDPAGRRPAGSNIYTENCPLCVQMAGGFAELELSMIRARVRSGMENAKAKGRRIGRRPREG